MTINKTVVGLVLAAMLALVAGALLISSTKDAYGAAFTGQAAYLTVATTTSLSAGIAATVLPANPTCRARVISTTGESAIMVLFGDSVTADLSSTTMSGSKGHWQAASTTVAYDSGLYGCGKLYVRAYAATTLTVSEF
jgi:hypothetical protein